MQETKRVSAVSQSELVDIGAQIACFLIAPLVLIGLSFENLEKTEARNEMVLGVCFLLFGTIMSFVYIADYLRRRGCELVIGSEGCHVQRHGTILWSIAWDQYGGWKSASKDFMWPQVNRSMTDLS